MRVDPAPTGRLTTFDDIYRAIMADPLNADKAALGHTPVYTAAAGARIVIVGQAPGRKAQDSHKPWNDVSGQTLRRWLGVSDEQFYDPNLFALIPMDFYYPGKGAHGDLPPRKGFAAKWHPPLRALMPHIELTILVGNYAQKYYLGDRAGRTLTETVHNHKSYEPEFFPLVHPSPLNFRWRAVNPWFETIVVPDLYTLVRSILTEYDKTT